MINEDRFWEASIAEAVSDKRPPDVTGKVLAELAVKEEEPPKKRGRIRVLRWGLELAAAAAVVVGIGLATGIIKLPGGDDGDEVLPPQEVAAAPGAEYEYKDGIIELKSGWLLVTTGAPTVICQGSELSKVDGRVLIHAGSMPPGERPESVANWLNANNVETDMVNNIKHWVKGIGLAALVLSGTAMLDGQEIKAPEPQPQSTAEWHVIRSVMDIDNLPKDAKYVTAEELNAAHLDFLAEKESLEGIRMRWCRELRAEHLESLRGLPKLRILDIRGANWAHKPDLSPLLELKALERLGADLLPASWEENGARYYRSGESIYHQDGNPIFFDYTHSILPVYQALSERNVAVDLGDWDPVSQDDVKRVLTAVPTIRSVVIEEPSVGELKVLSQHEQLRAMQIRAYKEGQIGLAYLARSAQLEEFSIDSRRISIDEIHQISRMDLRFLRIDAELDGSPEQCFEKLAAMKKLRELEVRNLSLKETAFQALEKFKDREALDRLRIEDDVLEGDARGLDFMLAHWIPTRRLELAEDGLSYWQMEEVPESLRKGSAGKQLEVFRIDTSEAYFDEDIDSGFAQMYKAYPNLKRIEVRRGSFEFPAEQDQFVRWLKANLPDVEVVVTP